MSLLRSTLLVLVFFTSAILFASSDAYAASVVSVTSSTPDGSYNAGNSITVHVSFDEVVTVDTSGGSPTLTLETGSTDRAATYSGGSGSTSLTFSYTVQSGDTSAHLTYTSTSALASNGALIQDSSLANADLTLPEPLAAGSLAANSAIVIDTTAPGVTISTGASNPTNSSPFVVTFSFTETVTGLTVSDIVVTNGAASALSGSGSSYTANITPSSEGIVRVDLPADHVTDLAGNGNTAAPQLSRTYDSTAPTISGVTSSTSNGSYSAGQSIVVLVNFSESVTVTGAPRLTLETGATDVVLTYSGTTGSPIAAMSFTYVVQAGHTSNDLDYVSTSALSLNGGSIIDSAGNAATLTLASPGAAGSLGANSNLVIDTTSPNVSSVTSSTANATYVAGEIISIQVSFSEPVTVTGSPRLTLETGSSDAVVSYSGATGTPLSTLTFNYTVASGHQSADLEYQSTSALALNGGTILDAAGNAASLTLPALGSAQSLGGSKAIVIDAVAPTVTGVTSTTTNGTYGVGQVINVRVDFSESVIVVGAPQITLETGSADATLTYAGPTGSPISSLSFSYTVAAGHNSLDLDYTTTTSLVLNGGSIVDAAGNVAVRTLANPGTSGSLGANKALVIDTTAPTLVLSSGAAGTTNLSPFTVTFTFNESVTGFTASDVTVTNGSIGAVSGSGSTYTAPITPAADGTVTVAVADNVAQDTAGNGNTAATNLTRTYDGTAPQVTSVNSTTADGTYIVGNTITVTVAVSEPVTVTGSPRLLLNLTASNVNATYSAGSSTSTVLAFTYTVASGNSSADLDYVATNSLSLNGGTIRDTAGNNLVLTLATPGAANSLGANRDIVIDGIIPTVTSVTSTTADGTYLQGSVIDVSVNFSKPVRVTGTPRITLATTTNATVNYSGETNTLLSTLTFTYTVATGHQSADLNYAATNSLVLNSGTIRDAAGNNATLTLPATNSASSLAGSKAIVVDARAPTISSVTANPNTGSFRAGQSITINVNFSEPVTVTGSPTLRLETGASDAVLTYSGASPITASTLPFTYTVQAGHTSSDLQYHSTTAFALNGATIVDAVNLPLTTTLPATNSAQSLGGSASVIIDTTAPTVSLVTSTTADGSYRATQTVNIQVRFNENVTVTGTPQITLETGAVDAVVNYVNTSGQNVNFTYTIAAGHESNDLNYLDTTALVLNGGTIRDAAGNDATLTLHALASANSLAGQKNITIDTTRPDVTLSTAALTTSSIPFTVTVTATESILAGSFTVSDFVISNGAAASLTGSGATRTVSIYPYTQGTVTIDLPAGAITDAAGNQNTASNQLQVTVATGAPFVSSVTSSAADGTYGLGAVIPIQLVFSENVTVSGTPQLTLETGAADAVVDYSSGSGTNTLTFNYTVDLNHSSNDLDYIPIPALSLNGGSIRDTATLTQDAAITMSPPGNFGSLGASKNLVVDGVVPAVTGVTSSLANGSYRAGQVVPIQVTFSKAVTVTGNPQITLETGATDAVVNYTSGSGSSTLVFNYTVGAGHTSLDLDYVSTTALALNGGTIRDSANNNATLTLASPGAATSLGANRNIVVDTTAPQVSLVTSTTANGSYGVGATINVRVTFNEPITVATGTPHIALDAGVRTAFATYVTGSGTANLDFTYSVLALDTSDDLAYTATDALQLNGATLRDAAGNDAVLTLAAPGAANSLNANKAIVIDATAPTITNVTSSATNGRYTVGAAIQIQVQFSENVIVTGNPTLSLAVGGPERNATYQSGSTTSTLTFLYTVQSGDTSNDLDYTSTTALGMTGATIRDGASNNAVVTLATPGAALSLSANKDLIIDTTAPTVLSVAMVTANGTYKVGSTIDFVVNFSGAVLVTGTPTVLLETGATDGTATYVTGSNSSSLNFRYTVASGEESSDLDFNSAAALSLSGGTIRDAATNNAVLTLPFPGLSVASDVVIDGIAPEVSRVTSSTANGEYTAGAVVNIRVIFPEVVLVTGTPTVTLETGSSDGVATYVDGSGTTQLNFSYTVLPGHTSFDLDYESISALQLNGGTIRDIAGNDAVTAFAAPGTTGWLSDLKEITIDTTPPRVASVSSTTTDGRYRADAEITITVDFDETVLVTGTPLLTVANGAAGRNAVYQSGSNSSTLTFLYTVMAGDNSADLDCISSTPVVLNGGTIRDLAGNFADPTLPTPGQANSLGANKDIIIDTLSPYVTGVTMVTADGSYREGAVIDFTVTFSEIVAVTGTPTITLETGASDGVASFTGGSGTTTLSFRYTVAAGENSTDLDFNTTAVIIAGAGTIVDQAGNDGVLTLPLPGLSSVANVVVDTIRPTMTFTSTGGNPTNDIPIGVTVTFSEAVTGFDASDIALTNGTLSNFVAVSSSVYSFDVTATVDGAVSVNIPENTSFDLALNQNVAGTHQVTYDSTPPSVVLTTTAPPVISRPSFTVSVAFSEPITGFTIKDILIENGLASSLVGSGQNFRFKVAPIAEGQISITLPAGTVSDLAGNPNTISNTLSRTRDSLPPSPPVILSPVQNATLSSSSVTFTGEANSSVTVKVYSGTTILCTTEANELGEWSCNSSDLVDGRYTIHAIATDSINNSSQPSPSVDIIIDAVPLPPPLIAAGLDTVTTDRTPRISGVAVAGTEITLLLGDRVVCSTDTHTDGTWSCEASELAVGTHTLTATAYDSRDGSRSAPTQFVVTIGMTVTCRVVVDDENQSPLDGVTISSPFSTGTTDNEGRTEVVVATVNDFNLKASKSGWRIIPLEDPDQPDEQASVLFKATPTINPVSFAIWDNNSRGVQHTALVTQASDSTANGVLTPFRASGQPCAATSAVTTAAYNLSSAAVPTASCGGATSFGVVQLQYNSENFRALLRYSRGGGGTSDASMATEADAEFSNGIRGRSYVSFDSVAATLRGVSQTRFVQNALLLANVADEPNSYRIRTYSAAGALQRERTISLPPKGTTRLSSSFSGRLPRDSGIHEITPTNPAAPYLAEVRRYGYLVRRRALTPSFYSTRFAARQPTNQELAFPTQLSSRELTNNYFELINVQDAPLSVRLSFEPSDTSPAQSFDVVVPARGLTKVPFTRLVSRTGVGTTILLPNRPNALVAHAVLNLFGQSKSIASSQAVPLADLLGSETIVPIERRLQTSVALTNRSDIDSSTTLTCYANSEIVGIEEITVPARASTTTPTSQCLGGASSGVLVVTADTASSVAVDLFRFRSLRGLRLQGRVR